MAGCPSCGTQNFGENKFCCECGFKLEANTGELPAGALLEGRYKIVRSLGRGGMGAVYLAQDSRLNNSLVAIKEMSVKVLTDEELETAVEAFKQEATMLINLRNQALPRVIDFFSIGERHWYLTMDFIEGETLKSIIERRGSISEAEVIAWAGQLCKILDYLHSQNPPIIFRDLKPANIMLTGEGIIKLIDFGIARHFKAGITQDTTAYGSTGFAPPEQYGQNQTDARSDIYALGATLHYLLTGIEPGAKPFTFDNPSEHVKVSDKFEAILLKALDFKPENRFSTMQELLKSIEALTIEKPADGTTLISEIESGTLETTVLRKRVEESNKEPNKQKNNLYLAVGAVLAALVLFSVIGVIVLTDSNDDNRKGNQVTSDSNSEPLKADNEVDDGDGTLLLPNGAKYTGEIMDGKANGQGIARWTNGDKYVGEFSDNKMHGYGTFTWNDGEKLEGEYRNDKYMETMPENQSDIQPDSESSVIPRSNRNSGSNSSPNTSTVKPPQTQTPAETIELDPYEEENIINTVFYHYGSIPHDLEYAYNLFSSRWQKKVPWSEWKKGFSKTISDTVHYVDVVEISSNKALADFAMTSRDAASDGRVLVKEWTGRWKLVNEYGEWKLDEPKIENTAEYYE